MAREGFAGTDIICIATAFPVLCDKQPFKTVTNTEHRGTFLPLNFPPVKGFTALLYFYWYVICTGVSPRTIRRYCTRSRSCKILLRNLDNWQCRGQYLYHGYYYHCNPTCWRRDLKLAPSCFWCRQKFLLTCNIITVFLLARQINKWMTSSKVWS